MIQVHSKTILSMEFNPMDQAHGNCLSKPMVNLMAIISISLKSNDNYLYFTNIHVIIRGLHSISGELCKRTFLIHLGSCQHFATLLFSLFPLLHGESLLKNVLMKN